MNDTEVPIQPENDDDFRNIDENHSGQQLKDTVAQQNEGLKKLFESKTKTVELPPPLQFSEFGATLESPLPAAIMVDALPRTAAPDPVFALSEPRHKSVVSRILYDFARLIDRRGLRKKEFEEIWDNFDFYRNNPDKAEDLARQMAEWIATIRVCPAQVMPEQWEWKIEQLRKIEATLRSVAERTGTEEKTKPPLDSKRQTRVPVLNPGQKNPANELPRAIHVPASATPTTKHHGVPKLGIIGGSAVGKSYLFQAMVYRTQSSPQAGSLAYYLDRKSAGLSTTLDASIPKTRLSVDEFIDTYSKWERLEPTRLELQRWYQLSLHYRSGFLGLGHSELAVEFLDASGEAAAIPWNSMEETQRELWQLAYLDAAVMVFCLPLWVVFPNDQELADPDFEFRGKILKHFDRIVTNYREMRETLGVSKPVRSILALTMADDRRNSLVELRDRWISPYMNTPEYYLKHLRTGGGIARYLANARQVSQSLRQAFDNHRDARISRIPNSLIFGSGLPWLIPLSAIAGDTLEGLQKQAMREGYKEPAKPRDPPVPVHVELPLLVALCEHENALM